MVFLIDPGRDSRIGLSEIAATEKGASKATVSNERRQGSNFAKNKMTISIWQEIYFRVPQIFS